MLYSLFYQIVHSYLIIFVHSYFTVYKYFLTQPNKKMASICLSEWIIRAKESGLKEFSSCITAFNNWFDEICNSFDYPWSNGPLEGTHTKIKTLKRNCFGMRNFDLFRKRIMFSCK
ncbi:ISL3 family transposase [Peptoniphilus asaccharolyticus]